MTDALADLQTRVESCTSCVLSQHRATPVVSSGSNTASVMFVGEAPGAEEDRTGRPFVGRSGRLLDQLIVEELGCERDEVYVANVIKCRPPDNRNPTSQEVATCRGYLDTQIAEVDPAVIVPLGNFATRLLLSTTAGITQLRGQRHQVPGLRPTIVPTFHPAAVLRGGAAKLVDMKSDFSLVRDLAESQVPS